MTLQSMSFIFGAILLAVGILGGGFEVKEIKVSNVSIGVRIVAGIVGLVFVGFGFWQQPSAVTEPGLYPRLIRTRGLIRTRELRYGATSGCLRASAKAGEALVAEQIPFISDRERIDVGAALCASTRL